MKNDFKEVIDLYHQGLTADEIVEETDLSRATVFRYIKLHKTSLEVAAQHNQDEDFEDDEPTQEEPAVSEDYLGAIKESNELRRKEIEAQERKAEIEKERLKRSIIKRYKNLQSDFEILTSLEQFAVSSASKLLEQIEALKESLDEYFDFEEDELSENSLAIALQIISNELSDVLENENSQAEDFQPNWPTPLIGLLDYDPAELLEQDELTMEFYLDQKAHWVFSLVSELLTDLEGEKVDEEKLKEVIELVSIYKSMITDTLNQIDENDDHTLSEMIDVIEAFLEYFEELSIRCNESFWGTKRVEYPENLIDEINSINETDNVDLIES